jgi:hypothetical protein
MLTLTRGLGVAVSLAHPQCAWNEPRTGLPPPLALSYPSHFPSSDPLSPGGVVSATLQRPAVACWHLNSELCSRRLRR